MNREELRELVAKILELDVTKVTDDSVLTQIGWDSLADLSFIAEIDSRMNVQIASVDLSAAETFNELAELVNLTN